jgi:hypothetical protein
MITLFDVITVTCFIGLVAVFFRFTNQDTRTLLQFLLSGIVFAIANQVGNAGSTLLAGALMVAGVGYACLNVRQQ